MFIVEQANGSSFELESRDITFLENDFLQSDEVKLDLDLFDNDESDTSTTPHQLILHLEDHDEEFHPSGSERNIQISNERPLHSSDRTPVPRHCFDMETRAIVFQKER